MEGCGRERNIQERSFGVGTVSGDDESESCGEGVNIVTSETNDTKRKNTRSFQGELYQLLGAPQSAYTAGFCLTRCAEDPPVKVLPMLRLPLTALSYVSDQQFVALRTGKFKRLKQKHPRTPARNYF